jgi:hypothetical protein
MFWSMFTRDRGFIFFRTNIFEILKIYLGNFLETYLYHTCTEEYKPSITSKHTWKHTWKHTLKHTCKVTTCTFISVVIVTKILNTPFSISLTRGRIRFWSVVTYLGSRMFFFLWRLVRPSQNGERAGPLAKMLLGAKHGGRPRIVSRIIVEEYFALWVFPTCSTAMFYFASGTQETTV